jgi:DNA repair protein RadC
MQARTEDPAPYRVDPAGVTPAVVKDLCRLHFAAADAAGREEFAVMFLDHTHRLIELKTLFRGTLAATSVYPREVVKEALALNAGAVVLAHNHPSGSPEPSRADEYLTRTLKDALTLVDVRVLDHIVAGNPATVSFAERGLL